MIDKQLLIELFEQKDRKRRAQLFDMFALDIHCSLTRARIADIISAKLGRPRLIAADDIRYCRFYFKDVKPQKHASQQQPLPNPKEKASTTEFKSSTEANDWSNGDEIKLEDQFIFKSKYAKKP